MTRTRYLTSYSLNLLGELVIFAAFGGLAWTAVLDAETFVLLIERQHYALALLITSGTLAFICAAAETVPALHSIRSELRARRELTIIRTEHLQQCRRIELLMQTPINNDADARKVLRFARTMKSGGQ